MAEIGARTMDGTGTDVGGAGGVVVQAGERRVASLEALRAVAALTIVVYHVHGVVTKGAGRGVVDRLMVTGRFSVLLFFVLSGYLLYKAFARRDFGSGSAVDLRRYAINRAVRVLPLYFTVCAVLLVFVAHGATLRHWLLFMSFSQEYSSSTVGTLDEPMWSMIVEVQFYALLPLVALGVARLSRRRPGLAAAIIAVPMLPSLIVHLTVLDSTRTDLRWAYSMVANGGFICLGMLVALFEASGAGRRLRLPAPLDRSDVWIAVGVAALVAMTLLGPVTTLWPREVVADVAVPLVVAACILPLRRGVAVRALSARPLALLGMCTYSLYLWHGPMLTLLVTRTSISSTWGLLALELPGSIAVAALSYAVVERPFLRLRRRWVREPVAPQPHPAAALAPAGAPAL